MTTNSFARWQNKRDGHERGAMTNRITKQFKLRDEYMSVARYRKANLDTFGPDMVVSAVNLARLYNRHARYWIRARAEFDAERAKERESSRA